MKDTRKHYSFTESKFQQQTFVVEEEVDKNKWKKPLYLFLDQASSTGYSMFDDDSKLVLSGVMKHEPNVENRSEFVHAMVKEVEDMCVEYGVQHLFHEEVFIDGTTVSMETAEKLHYIKSHIQDIKLRHPNIEIYGLDTKKWKSELAKPERFKFSKGATKDKQEKAETLKHVTEIFPLVSLVTDDESDALGMGVAIMIKDRNKRNIYNVTRFNKKLPIHLEIFNKSFDFSNDDAIQKLRVMWKRPANIGGVVQLPLDNRKNIETPIRQFLSHKDALVFVEIPATYKNWGMILLEQNLKLSDIDSEDNSYYLVASRKRRL